MTERSLTSYARIPDYIFGPSFHFVVSSRAEAWKKNMCQTFKRRDIPW